jgi:hypothetical protein
MHDACRYGDYSIEGQLQHQILAEHVVYLPPIMSLQPAYAQCAASPPYCDSAGTLYRSGRKHLRQQAFPFVLRAILRSLPLGSLLICSGWNATSPTQEFTLQRSLIATPAPAQLP